MKSLLIFTAIIAACSAATSLLYTTAGIPTLRYPAVYTATGNTLITPTQQQYMTQDELGQYAYGYIEPHSTKQEVRSLDGITRGSYSYRDAAGELQTVEYIADAEGFHVAATNLPRTISTPAASSSGGRDFRNSEASSVASNSIASASTSSATATGLGDTSAVATARAIHLAAHEEAKLRLAQNRAADQSQQYAAVSTDLRGGQLPGPVADTPEVAAAKSIHLKRVEAEKLRNEALSSARAHIPVSVYVPRIYSTYGYPGGFYY